MHPTEDNDAAAQREMPRYISHKQVWALEIAVADRLSCRVSFIDPGYAGVTLPAEMWSRYQPVQGDFYVVYTDGYKAFSPRKAFLEGYRREGEYSPAGAEIARLRDILRSCVRGPDIVDLGNGETIGLHLPHKDGGGLNEIKQGLKIGRPPRSDLAATNPEGEKNG